MAAIDHSDKYCPGTYEVTLDGTTQQVIHPDNTRRILWRFETTAGEYKLETYQATAAAVSSDLVPADADIWYATALAGDAHTGGAAPAGNRSPLYLEGTLGETVYIEYSHIGGQ